MIDPKLLTPENGFVDDTIVLVEFDCSPSNTMPQYLIGRWEDIKFHFETGTLDFFMAISKLSVLTGPMAIWNLAPEWAETCMIWPFTKNIEWIKKDGEIKSIGMATFTTRPFWTKMNT